MSKRNPFQCPKCHKYVREKDRKSHHKEHIDESLRKLRQDKINASRATNIANVELTMIVNPNNQVNDNDGIDQSDGDMDRSGGDMDRSGGDMDRSGGDMDQGDDGMDQSDGGMNHGVAFSYSPGFEEIDDVAAITRASAREINDETELDSDSASEWESELSSELETDTWIPGTEMAFNLDQILVNQDDVQVEDAANHQTAPPLNSIITSNVVESLQASKNDIDKPLQFDIKEISDSHLDSQQKFSVDFHSLMSPERVDRQTQRDLLQLWNSHVEKHNAGNLNHNETTIDCKCQLNVYSKNFKIESEYLTRKNLEDIYCPLKFKEFHICRNGCCMYFEGNESTECHHCKHARLDENGLPFATIKQLSLAEQLAHLVSSREFREAVMYKNTRRTIYHQDRENLNDYFDGSKYSNQSGPSSNDSNINLGIYTDGFNPFKRGGLSMTIVMFVIMNLSPELRYRKENIIIPIIIPGPLEPKNIQSFLHNVHKDLLVLQDQGMEATFEHQKLNYTATLEIAIGDIPACAHMCGHSGHGHYHGCRICTIRATSLSSSIRYFPQPQAITHRTRESFKYPDTNLGTKTLTPLFLYDTFDGPFFMGLDEMHFWGANLGGKTWSVISDNEQAILDINNPLFLRKFYRELISQAIVKCRKTIHGSAMDGVFLDVETKYGSRRSVDWIDFIKHVLPMTVVEAIQCQKLDMREKEEKSRRQDRMSQEELHSMDMAADSACYAISALSNACCISQKYSLTKEDVKTLESTLAIWLTYVNTTIHSPKVLTINHHCANHLVEAIKRLGPLRTISARVMERSIGIIKHNIKSRQKPAENSFNYVKDHFTSTRRNINEALCRDQQVVYASSTTKITDNQLIKIIGKNSITKIRSFYPSIAGQEISLKGHRINNVVYETDDTDNDGEFLLGEGNMKYGALTMLYTDNTDDYALIEVISPLKRDYCAYYDKENHRRRLARIEVRSIVAFGIEIESIDKRKPNRVNFSWNR